MRMRGGGVYKLCPSCRKKAYNESLRVRKKIEANRVEYAVWLEQQRIEQDVIAITRDFNRTTYHNRQRIRLLEKNTNPSKRTLTQLKHRKNQQQKMELILNDAITRIKANQRVGSFYEAVDRWDAEHPNAV